jgi:2-polyprenyl-3-methyl-5-hydroxy-6-metoxy-1,4-benzoquinol methylase
MPDSMDSTARPTRSCDTAGWGGFGWTVPPTRLPELMDDPGLPEAEHLKALTALRRINALSFTAAGLAREVAALAAAGVTDRVPDCLTVRGYTVRDFTVVDVACGGGDVTLDLAARLARSPSVPPRVHVIGIDVSPRAVSRARSLAEDSFPAGQAGRSGAVSTEFTEHDIVAAGCPPCDVAVSSLFLHHLEDDAAVAVLRSMAAAARMGIVISDLVRSGLGLALAVLGTTVLSGSRVARVDGPRSVRAARTPAEYRRLLDSAGLTTARIRRTWPERVLLTWSLGGTAGETTDRQENR